MQPLRSNSILELYSCRKLNHSSRVCAGFFTKFWRFNNGLVGAKDDWLKIELVKDVVHIRLEAEDVLAAKKFKVLFFGETHVGIKIAGSPERVPSNPWRPGSRNVEIRRPPVREVAAINECIIRAAIVSSSEIRSRPRGIDRSRAAHCRNRVQFVSDRRPRITSVISHHAINLPSAQDLAQETIAVVIFRQIPNSRCRYPMS